MVDELAPPLGYSTVWLWLLLALSAGPMAIWLARWAMRIIAERRGRVSPSARHRNAVLAAINEVENGHASGKLSSREAHIKLSELLRGFVVVGGANLPMDRMTLRDLESGGADSAVVNAVREFYDGAFPAEPDGDVRAAATKARTVVAEWT